MDSKRKVLHVSFGGLGNGGVSAVIFSIVRPLFHKYQFGCVVFNNTNTREIEFQQYGKIYRIKCFGKKGISNIIDICLRPFKLYIGVYRICKREGYDVVHAHNGSYEGFCLMAAKHAKVPLCIAHSHNTPSPLKQTFGKCLLDAINVRLINKYADYKVGCSALACKTFFQTNDYEVIINSIDIQKFAFDESKDKDSCIILNVGRYCYQKNQEFLIRAFLEIKKKIPHSILKLVGFGEDKEKLQSLINQLALNESVQLIDGKKVNMADIYHQANYFIFPSRYEGFGIVLLEAQASGCFCFASNVVPMETDLGMLEVIPLEYGEKYWGEYIANQIIGGVKFDYNDVKRALIKYDENEVSKEYSKLYK